MTFEDATGTRTIRDVLAGEVWIASGQSNMHMRVRYLRPQYRGVIGRRDAIATSDDPLLRILDVEERVSATPCARPTAHGQRPRPKPPEISARSRISSGGRCGSRLGVPVGVITTDWGGTRAEAWTPLDDLAPFPGVADEVAAVRALSNQPAATAQSTLNHNSPAALYHGMIAPLGNVAARGFIWYQGESNRQNAREYADLFPTMIGAWRRDTANPDASFLYVQIAPLRYGKDGDDRTAWLRESQRRSLRVPNTAMVVTADIGEPRDIHPRQKRVVGDRLALAALATTYGIEDGSAALPSTAHRSQIGRQSHRFLRPHRWRIGQYFSGAERVRDPKPGRLVAVRRGGDRGRSGPAERCWHQLPRPRSATCGRPTTSPRSSTRARCPSPRS